MTSRWAGDEGVQRGDEYDRKWTELAAAGASIHGEADLVGALLAEDPELPDPARARVLDAGCGTGRVAIELDARGVAVHGVDLDPAMLATARAKAPALSWTEADLATLDLAATFDLAVMAGNVMLFVAPGTEGAVVGSLARHLRAGGLLVAGFQLGPGWLGIDEYDRHATAAGLEPVARWATWERAPFAGVDYVVAVHRRIGP